MACASSHQSKLSAYGNKSSTFFKPDCEIVTVSLWIQHNSGFSGEKGSTNFHQAVLKMEIPKLGHDLPQNISPHGAIKS